MNATLFNISRQNGCSQSTPAKRIAFYIGGVGDLRRGGSVAVVKL
jgi:hypothetical protein